MNALMEWIKSQAKSLIATGIIILVVFVILFIVNIILNRFLRKHHRKRAITVAKLAESIFAMR